MISLFINRSEWSRKVFSPPDVDNVNNRLKAYIDTVIAYFHRSNYIALNNNILIQIIKHMDIDFRWDDVNIIRQVNDNLRNIMRPLGISSEIYVEVISGKNTIIKDALEIIYMNNKTKLTNYTSINKNTWNNSKPLVFRNHDFRDLYGNHPDRIILDKKSLVIYDIDIVKLILMYKYYALDRYNRGLNESIAEFIGCYVLTNSIPSMVDIAILNNYLNKGNIYNPPKQYVATSNVPIIEGKLNMSIIDKSILEFERQSIVEILYSIKLISVKNAYDLLFMENFYESSRSRVYLSLISLDFISYLLNFIDIDSRDNSAYMKLLKYDIGVLAGTAVNTNNEIVNKKYRDLIKTLGSRL